MIFTPFGLGLLAGAALGTFNGRDLERSIAGIVERRSRVAVFAGLFKRSVLFLGALSAALCFGRWALLGLALGYLAGFALAIARRVRSGVC